MLKRCCISKSSAGKSPSASRFLWTEQQKQERYALLRDTYDPFNKETDPIRKEQYKKSGELWKRKWEPFRSRHHVHLAILENPHFSKLIPKRTTTIPFRFDDQQAASFTASSCRLEGSTITTADVSSLGVSAADATLSPPSALSPKVQEVLSNRTMEEVNEAYYHMLALYFAQDLALKRPTFALSVEEFRHIHSMMMHPFEGKHPGLFRTTPISVNGFHLACFPYAPEVPALVKEALQWMSTANPENEFLHAFDIFLVFAHLHPFHDGNGRMSRLLSALYLAHCGYAPVSLHSVNRSEYLRHVYEAQHLRRSVEFYKWILSTSALG